MTPKPDLVTAPRADQPTDPALPDPGTAQPPVDATADAPQDGAHPSADTAPDGTQPATGVTPDDARPSGDSAPDSPQPAADGADDGELPGATAASDDAQATATSSAPDTTTAAGSTPDNATPDDTTPGDARATADETSSEEPPSGGGRAGGAGGEGRGSRVTRARILGAVGAMVVAAIAATAVLQGIGAAQAEDARARLEAERSLRLEVSGAASAFSKALLSYDYRDLQSTRATLTAQATGDFLATYDTAFGGAFAQVIVKLKATSLATVREVYLADVDEATAHAIVVVDQQVNTSEAIRSVKDSHLKISLVKEKGAWKVHDVTVLGAASEDQYTLDGGDEKKKD